MPLLVAGTDGALARRLQRLAQQGKLRRIHAGIYTDDLVQPLESIVRREIFALTSLIAPGSIISHRSASEGGRPTAGGSVFLTGPSRRNYARAHGDCARRRQAVALNLFLTAAGLTRIIIPTVFRDDYISALKAMSGTGHPVPLERMFTRAARFSRWLDLRSKDAAFAALKRSNALEEPSVARLSFDEQGVLDSSGASVRFDD